MSGWQDAPVIDAPAPAAPGAGAPGVRPAPAAQPDNIWQDPREPSLWRNPDGTPYGVNSGVAVALGGPEAPDRSFHETIDTDAARVQNLLRARPELASAPPPPQPATGGGGEGAGAPAAPAAPQPAPTASAAPGGAPGASWMDAPEVKAESYSGGGGDPGKPKNGVEAVGRSADSFIRAAANAASFGLADKLEAASPAVPAMFGPGGMQEFLRQYSRNLDGQQIRDKADFKEVPLAAFPGMVTGAVAQGVLLPPLKAAGVAGRVFGGATQGATLGALDSLGNSRGNPFSADNLKEAAKTGAISAGIGGALGGVLGPRLPQLENPHGVASIADHDLVQVQPIAATQGGHFTRQISQVLASSPMGGPLRRALGGQQHQTAEAVDRLAGLYGSAENAAEGGAPIVAANGRAVAADQAARTAVEQGIGNVAQRYGFQPARRVAGEDVQAGVERFARGDRTAAPNAAHLPARATSFSQKAGKLYDQAFGRLDQELAGKTGSRPPAGAAGLPQKGAASKVSIGGKPVDLSAFGPAAREAVETAGQSMQDRALNVIRTGKRVRPNKGPSLLEFVSKNGGVRDEGGELSGLDAQLWHREAAFRNKAVRPDGRSLEDMARLAHDQGYFPEVGGPSWEGRDNMQALNGDQLLEAIRQELAGNKRYAEFDPQQLELQGHVNDLQELIDHLGIDPRKANNRQIKAAIDEFMGVQAGSTSAKAARAPGASQIDPAATQSVLQDIFERNQSPAVRDLLLKPEVKRLADAVHDVDHLSFQDLRDLRTWVREAQDDPKLRQSIGAANLERLESTLTEDIYRNARKLGSPGAEKLLRRADQFYAAGSKRINGALDTFFRVRSGEAAFDRILGAASTGGGANIARLRALQRSLRPEEWGEVASGAIGHMGEGRTGFELDKFIRSFDGLSAEGRQVLFGGRNADLHRSLERLVDAGKNTLANPPKAQFGETANAAFEGLLAAAKARGRSANLDDVHALRGVLSAKEWGDVAAGVIRTMGRTDEGLSIAKFVTEWDKLSPAAREALFAGPGREDGAKALDALVRVMKQQKAAGKLYNHSNTANHLATALIIEKPAEALLKGEFHEVGIMAALGAVANVSADLLASPKFARFAAWYSQFQGPFSAAEKRLDDMARADPAKAERIEYFKEVLRKVRANSPQAIGASEVQRERQQGRVDPRSLPQLSPR